MMMVQTLRHAPWRDGSSGFHGGALRHALGCCAGRRGHKLEGAAGEPLASAYRVTVDGVSIPVYTAKSVHGGDYASRCSMSREPSRLP